MRKTITALVLLIPFIIAGCATDQTSSPAVSGTYDFTQLEQIASDGFEWPRELISNDQSLILDEPPQRVLSLSVGHDEILFELLEDPAARIVAVGSATPGYSNIGDLVEGYPTVGRDVEQLLELDPDIIILDIYAQRDFIDQLEAVGLTVFQTSQDDQDFNIPNILTLGYLLGVEDRATQLVNNINERLDYITNATPSSDTDKVEVALLSKYSDIWASGAGSTGGNIIDAAGATNAAAEVSPINGQISFESILRFDPAVIAVFGAPGFREELLNEPSLANVRAIRDQRVYVVTDTYYSSLSHWTVCGIEQIAKLVYPDQLNDLAVCKPF